MTYPGISVVIPVLGDTAELRRLLSELVMLAPPPAEIIVVDGAGDAACRELCGQSGARYRVSVARRGHQLRDGAAQTRGEILWFLHADAEVEPGSTMAILDAIHSGADGGHFRFRFTGPGAPHKTLLAALINVRARFWTAYGDQGLFATRPAYESAGGFADTPLFEEVPLVRGLRRSGRFVSLAQPLGVSPRRWERDGWLRRSLENRLLAVAYCLGVSPERLARLYRGPARTRGAAVSD